jgi:hypothetical protein
MNATTPSTPGVLSRVLASAILFARQVRIVSYQNSGRTWLRVMLSDLGIRAKFTHAGAAYRFRLEPDEVCRNLDRYRYRNIVFLARDPLDAIVSNYFQATRTDKVFEGTIKEFIRDPHWGLARMLAFNSGWYAARDRFRSFHLVRYETMVTDTEVELEKIVRFIRIPFIPSGAIARSAAANQFDAMKRREMTGELYEKYGDRFKQSGTAGDENLKVRRGKIGGYADYLDEDDIAYCRALIADTRYPL